MAAAALSMLGGHPGTQLIRALERVVEEAQLTGELRLSGRKLKEFPKIASKYNLLDTVLADLSKNKFSELPSEICDYASLERLDCYHNAIRTIPETVICLHSLTHLNLSRNQLSTLPVTLCQLPVLQVLIVSNNKLVSLPEEIGCLDQLMELDVSCNEISHLPPQIEDLENLKSLNLRRNLLVEFPIEITNLQQLIKLDISKNRITSLPTQLRHLLSLTELVLDNNPLSSPPSYLCTRGRVHIFKYLEIQEIKENKKRGVIDTEIRRSSKKKFNRSLNGIPLDTKSKRYTIDSGYNTSDGGGDRRWSQEFQDLSFEMDEARKLALRAAELTKEQRQERERSLHVRLSQLGFHHGYSSSGSDVSLVFNHDTTETLSNLSTPSTLSPNNKSGESLYEDAYVREAKRLCDLEGHKRINNEQNHLIQNNEEELRRTSKKIIEQQMEEVRKQAENNCNLTNHFGDNGLSPVDTGDGTKTFPYIQTYREYKEALRQQRSARNGSVYPRLKADAPPSETNSVGNRLSSPLKTTTNSVLPPSPPVVNNHTAPQEEFRTRHDSMIQQHQYHAQAVQRRLDERRKQKEAVLSYIKSRTSPQRLSDTENTDSPNHQPVTSPAVNSTQNSSSVSTFQPHFTFRREFDKAKEEAALIHQLRLSIEARLKVTLPEDPAPALMDGVVLCHLANHVRPRSVASIHVPSPAVPKLTMAKCRRNVENFIDACRRVGVTEEYICSPQDILEEKAAVRTAITVQALLTFRRNDT